MDARAFGKLVFVIIHHFPQISNIAFLFFSKNSLHFENSCYNISWSWACSAAGSAKGSVFCHIYNFILLYSSVPLLELLIWARSLVWESVRFASVRSSVRSRLGPPKLEIAAVFTAAISHLTTEIPQTDFCFDHLAGTPFRECPSFLFTAPQILSRALIQKHQTGHQNPLDRKFII